MQVLSQVLIEPNISLSLIDIVDDFHKTSCACSDTLLSSSNLHFLIAVVRVGWSAISPIVLPRQFIHCELGNTTCRNDLVIFEVIPELLPLLYICNLVIVAHLDKLLD